jgi:hypothetical protein
VIFALGPWRPKTYELVLYAIENFGVGRGGGNTDLAVQQTAAPPAEVKKLVAVKPVEEGDTVAAWGARGVMAAAKRDERRYSGGGSLLAQGIVSEERQRTRETSK